MTQSKQEIYLTNSIMQASKEELTLMLYNGAIRFCNIAIASVNSGNISEAHNNIVKVQNIIQEFQASLIRSYEVSTSFDIVYDYILWRLIDANVKKDVEILEEVNKHLRELRDTWKEAMLIAKGKKQVSERLA